MKTFLFIILAGYAVRCDDSNYFVVQMPDSIPTKEFNVYWNVPTMQCKSKKIYFNDLYTKFGIIQNTNDSFRGDRISILYDPGDFPALLSNSTSGEIKYRNGGVPQEGNLVEHLDTFQSVLEQSVPDKNFSGIGIIDFESWKPVLRQNFGVLTPYKDVSYEIEKKRHWWWKKQWIEEEAKRRFEGAAREFMQATVALAKKMRPYALWGYYGFPYCFNMAYNNRKETCADKVNQENDRISWLWKESTALYPSVYSSDDLTSGQLAALIRGRVNEAARVAVGGSPILPYFWYRYRDKGYFNESDLNTAFSTFYKSNASGFIIWGSSNDVNTVEKCENLKQYVTDVLGPAVAKYTKLETRRNEDDATEESYTVIFKPNNASKYDPEYTWIPPANYTQTIEEMVDKELKEEKNTTVVNKEVKESILVDMILHNIANDCGEGCDSRREVSKTDGSGDSGSNESRVVLVTEDPFKKNSSEVGVTVPTTTEDDIYDYDLSTGSVTVGDFYETYEYTDISTSSKNDDIITSTSSEGISTKPEDISSTTESTSTTTVILREGENSTLSENKDESSTITISTIKEDDLRFEVNNAIDYSTQTSTTDSSSTTLSTTKDILIEWTTESSTSILPEWTSTINNDLEEPGSSTTEAKIEISTEYSTSTTPSTVESTTDGTNSTKSESGTTLAPVLTEQVVVSVV